MRTVLTSIGMFLLLGLLAGCGDHGAGTHAEATDSHATEAEPHSDTGTDVNTGTDAESGHLAGTSHEAGLEDLERIQGRRWEMDDHTRSMFARMEKSFADADLAALEGDELKAAGAELQNDVNLLIEGCTMTGDAHEQLHLYLTGFIPAVAALSESGLAQDGEKVQLYLEQYPEYFE